MVLSCLKPEGSASSSFFAKLISNAVEVVPRVESNMLGFSRPVWVGEAEVMSKPGKHVHQIISRP